MSFSLKQTGGTTDLAVLARKKYIDDVNSVKRLPINKSKDITGKRFGRLTALFKTENNKRNKAMWVCLCDCGKYVIEQASTLMSGKVNSCGCLLKEWYAHGAEQTGEKSHLYKHGMCYTRINRIYRKIKQRCQNKNSQAYKRYGGRGIRICEEWEKNFISFYEWSIANGYNDSLTIDRIDNDGDYSPDNCRWADMKTQQNNRGNNTIIEIKGIRKTISEWCDEYGTNYRLAYKRIRNGWSPIDALAIPSGVVQHKGCRGYAQWKQQTEGAEDGSIHCREDNG